MKKIIFGASLVSALVLMSGCGDSGDDKVDIDAVVVEYKNSATYDLSEYTLATQSQTNMYVVKTFTNDKGKKSYQESPDETAYPIVRYDVNGSIVKEYDINGDLDTTNTILSDRISIDNGSSTMARFADKGDYVSKVSFTDNNGVTIKVACKINKQLASKEVSPKTYEDVLEMVCAMEGAQTTTLGGKAASVNLEGSLITYFAKGNGAISSIMEGCTKTKVGDTVVLQSCEKETEEITNIIK